MSCDIKDYVVLFVTLTGLCSVMPKKSILELSHSLTSLLTILLVLSNTLTAVYVRMRRVGLVVCTCPHNCFVCASVQTSADLTVTSCLCGA